MHDIIAHISLTVSFSLKLRIEKGGGNCIKTAVSSLIQLRVSEEQVRLKGEVTLHRYK